MSATQDVVSAAVNHVQAIPRLRNYLVRGSSFDESTVTRADLDQETSATVAADVVRFASRVADSEHVTYDPAYQVGPHQVLVDRLTNLPRLSAVVDDAFNDDLPPDVSETGTIRAMVHTLSGASGPLVAAVRIKGVGIATRRPKGWKALVVRDGIYVESDTEIIYYEPSFDILVVGDFAFVTKPSTIQQGIGSPERSRALARATFKTVTANLSIKGAAELEVAAGTQPAMVAKMASIARVIDSDPDYVKLLTTTNLATFLADNPQIEIEVEGSGTETQLVFDHRPQHRFSILKLIADDFLQSELSGRNYEAGSKQQQ